MMARTKTEIAANDLDMEMARLAGRIEQFAEDHAADDHRSKIDEISRRLFGSRSWVRQYMSKPDQDATPL